MCVCVGLCEQVNVPNRAVSFLIGKAGQTVSTLEKQSNAKVEFAKVRTAADTSDSSSGRRASKSESRGRLSRAASLPSYQHFMHGVHRTQIKGLRSGW